MGLTVTQRPNQYGSHVATGNPIVYKMSRKDFNILSVANSGGALQVTVNANLATLSAALGGPVVAGSILWVQTDNGVYVGSYTVVTCTNAANSVITFTAGTYTAAATTGYVNLTSNRSGYRVEVEIYYDNGGALAFSSLLSSPDRAGLVQFDVSLVNDLLTGDVTAYLGYGMSAYDAPNLASNVRAFYHADMCLGFFIKYRESWTGSAEAQTSDSANPFYAVKGARQVPVYAKLTAPFYGGYLKEYSEATGRKFLTRIAPKIWSGRPFLLSWIDPTVHATNRTHLRYTFYNPNGSVWGSFYHLPGNATPTLKGVYTANGNPIYSGQRFQYDREWNAGTSWSNLGSATLAPAVTLAAAASSKQIGVPVLLKAGTTYPIVINFSVAAGAGAETVFVRARLYSLNGGSVYATGTSANFGAGTSQTVTLNLTPSTDSYWLWIDVVHNGGVNARTVTVNYYSITSPDYVNAGSSWAQYITAELVNRDHVALTEATGISEVLTIPILNVPAVSPMDNLAQLVWTNSVGGQSTWCFDYSQEYGDRFDSYKRTRMTLFARGLITQDFEGINDLNHTGDAYGIPIAELLTTTNKTHERRGIKVYLVDQDGNRTGVLVIPTEVKTMSRRIQHEQQITIELPEFQTPR